MCAIGMPRLGDFLAEYSPVRESFTQLIKNFSPSSDDSESESESDATKQQAWSTDDSSDSSSSEDE
jgi:hypothetical protein